MFNASKGGAGVNNDPNYEVLLRNCNGKLTQWTETWRREIQQGMSFKPQFFILVNLELQLAESRFISPFSTFSACMSGYS